MGYATVYSILRSAGIPSPKRQRWKKDEGLHPSRPRRKGFWELAGYYEMARPILTKYGISDGIYAGNRVIFKFMRSSKKQKAPTRTSRRTSRGCARS